MFNFLVNLFNALEHIIVKLSAILAYFSVIITGVALSLSLVNDLADFVAIYMMLSYFIFTPLTVYVYYKDKRSAKKDKWRVPERDLHLMELAGGWPGALLAQQLFRHKIIKENYQLAFSLILIYHFSLWICFFLFQGKHIWISLIIFAITCGNIKYRN